MNRNQQLQNIDATSKWDIVIIGGGATGLGIALDASSRGLKTLLIEKTDFAKGTSSRSTKLLHGGVRYLAQGNLRLVKSALKERGILMRNAPHLTEILTFVLPFLNWYEKFYYGIGLKIYEVLSGKLSLGKTRITSSNKISTHLPSINTKLVKGGILYKDGQFDDARFAISLAQTAIENGATILNHCEALKLIKENEKIVGLVVKDNYNEKEYTIKTQLVINATGVFVENILALDNQNNTPIITPSQGVHIVIDKSKFDSQNALMIPKTKDGRVLFAIPWHNKVVIGTTDTLMNSINEEPKALEEEINYIVEHFNFYNNSSIFKKDILSVFVGLRPLIKNKDIKTTASLQRDHKILISPANLITITGGKWTTYRKMAEDVVDTSFAYLNQPFTKCITENIRIHGYCEQKNENEIFQCYGTAFDTLKKWMEEDFKLQEKIHPKYDYVMAQIKWAVEKEMALTVEDFLARRIRLLFLDAKAAVEASSKVANYMAILLNKDKVWATNQINNFNLLAQNYIIT